MRLLRFKGMNLLRWTGITLGMMVGLTAAWAKQPTGKAVDFAEQKPLSPTVGIYAVERTERPDGSLELMYRWNDEQLDRDLERTVVLNAETVINIGGKLAKLADLTTKTLESPSVATVGPDGVMAVMLRVGRDKLVVKEEQLTPKQLANLMAIAPKATAASDASYSERVAAIVAQLGLQDEAKAARVREIVLTQQKIVRDRHNAGFAPPKSARAALNVGLAAELTPEQIDQLKESLTGGIMLRTFGVYHEVIPELTPQQDAVIMTILREGREAALDIKNTRDMGAAMEPYKTMIETYITAQGWDWKEHYRAYTRSRRE